MQYRRTAHAVTDLKNHLTWLTKHRHKILRGDIAERGRDLLRQICVAQVTIFVAPCRQITSTCWFRRHRSCRRRNWCTF